MKNTITVKSTLEEAYLQQEQVSVWSQNSKKVYQRNIKAISKHMKSVGLEPIIENVTYDYCQRWLVDHYAKYQPSTLNQQKSTMTSLFRHLNNANIITGNPFLNVKIEDFSGDTHLSKDLNITELYQVYKAAHELQSDGINVLAPILLDIFTGLRSTNLLNLKVKSLEREECAIRISLTKEDNSKQLEGEKVTRVINSKNRECFLPIPPKTMKVLCEYTKGKDPDDPMLYGLRGKAFANKQMNYIVKKVCEHLSWIIDKPVSNGTSNNRKKIKTPQYFTPHGLRYSVATIFHDMGVEDNAIRMLLLHSKKTTLGALERYFRRDSREVKQLRMAQILLETVLETTLEMEEKFGVQMDLDMIYEQLSFAFDKLLKNSYYIHSFKDHIIRFTFSKMEQMLSNPTVANFTNPLFAATEADVPTTNFYNATNPYYQVGFQPDGFPTVSPQQSAGHYPPYFNGQDPFFKK